MIKSKMGSNWTIGGGDEPDTVGVATATLTVACAEVDVIWLVNSRESTANWYKRMKCV